MSKLLYENKIGKIYDESIEFQSLEFAVDYVSEINVQLKIRWLFIILLCFIGIISLVLSIVIDVSYTPVLIVSGFLVIFLNVFIRFRMLYIEIIVKKPKDSYELQIRDRLRKDFMAYTEELKIHHKEIKTLFYNFK